MNFMKVMNFLFNNIHSIFLLIGMLLIVLGITAMTNIELGIISLGVMFIVVGILIQRG